MTFYKTAIILRGVSGNGKTSFTRMLYWMISDSEGTTHQFCSTDDYFTDYQGNYNFDVTKLGEAHLKCQEIFENACKADVNLVVCANTNTRESDVNTYKTIAEKYGYTVFVMTLENWHGGKNIHNVPEAALEKQRNQLKNSIKL